MLRYRPLACSAAALVAAVTACSVVTPDALGQSTGAPRPEPAVAAPPGAVSFAALAPGEEIRVRYASRGCFHDVAHALSFTPGPGGARLAARTERANLAPGYRFVAPAAVPRADLERLDGLLAYYRSARGGGCTTTDSVAVTLYRGGRPVASERFVDGSCGLLLRWAQARRADRDEPAPLTFAALLRPTKSF